MLYRIVEELIDKNNALELELSTIKGNGVNRIVRSLKQAINNKDCYMSENTIRTMVEGNYEQLQDWDYNCFHDFACRLAANDCDWEEVCRQYDLK